MKSRKKFVLYAILAVLLGTIIYVQFNKVINNTQITKLEEIEYQNDPIEYVKDYIEASKNKDVNKVVYMEGTALENVAQISAKRQDVSSFANIQNTDVHKDSENQAVVRVAWDEEVNGLLVTSFFLEWDTDRMMWIMKSYGF